MAKQEYKKQARIARLCKNNRFVFDRSLTEKERDKISEWCHDNLSGAHYWFSGGNWHFESNADIGFHNKWDLVAFKLVWT